MIKKNNFDLAIKLFCFLIFVISLIIGHFHTIGTFGVETDFYGSYGIQAKNILSGKPYTYLHNPPGYPILIAAFSSLTGNLFTAAKILSSISFALIGFISYLIFKKLFSERTAFVSVIFLSLILLPYSFSASTDLVGAALSSIPILLLLNKEEINFKTSFIIGSTCGAAYLIRAETIFVLIGISFSILFILISTNRKEKIFKTCLLIIGFILITSPWFIYNWKINGSPFATTAYLQIGLYFYDDAWNEKPLIKKASEEKITSPNVLFINPFKLIWKYLKGIPSRIELFSVRGAPFPFILFLGGGIFLFLQNLNRKRLAYFVIWLTGFALLALISFSLRHYFVLLPFTYLLIAYFLFNEKLNYSRRANLFISIFIIVLSLFTIKHSYANIRTFINSEPRYLLPAAEFLKSHSSKDDIIVVRKPHLAYFSNLKKIFLFENSIEDFYKNSILIKARFIVYSDYEAELWPGLKTLSNPELLKDKFNLVYQHKPTNTLIYKIK